MTPTPQSGALSSVSTDAVGVDEIVRELLRDLKSPFPAEARAIRALNMGLSSIEKAEAYLAALRSAPPQRQEAPVAVELDSEKAERWPPLKKALFCVVTGETLNDGHYINAYRLTDKLYDAIHPSPAPLDETLRAENERLRSALLWMRDRDDRNDSLPTPYREFVDAALAQPSPERRQAEEVEALDWSQEARIAAERAMAYLGVSFDASKEPGDDPHRDKVCRYIQGAINAALSPDPTT